MVFIEISFKLGLCCLHEFHRNTSSFICNRFYTSGPQVYNNLYDKVSLCQWHSGTSGQTPGSIGALSTSIIMDTAWAHVGFVASNPCHRPMESGNEWIVSKPHLKNPGHPASFQKVLVPCTLPHNFVLLVTKCSAAFILSVGSNCCLKWMDSIVINH